MTLRASVGAGSVKRLLRRTLQLDNDRFGGFVVEVLIGMINRPVDLTVPGAIVDFSDLPSAVVAVCALFAGYREGRSIGVPFLLFLLIYLRELMILSGCQLRCFHQHALYVLVALLRNRRALSDVS